MSAQLDHDGGHRIASGLIDVTVPNAARASDFLQGGDAHFAADRKAAAALVESAPSIAAIPAAARAFRRRVVRHLAAVAGIGQFLEVGDGMVPAPNTHEVAREVDPGCRIVYVESDPMMADRMRARLASAPGGLVACVEGDVADVSGIVSAAGLSEAGLPPRTRRAGLPVLLTPRTCAGRATARSWTPASRGRSCCCPPSPTCPRRPMRPRWWRS